MSWRHKGLLGALLTGKPVTWTGIDIYRIACRRITEEWSEVDWLSRPRQLGVLAAPTP